MTVEFAEYKPLPTKSEPPRDAYITMWSDTLGTYTPESYKGILGRYRYEPRKQEAPTLLYTPDGETVKNRSTGETIGTLSQRKIGKFYHWHFQGVEVDGNVPEAAPLQIMWAIRGEAEEALEFARERYNHETYDHRLALYGGSYSMRKLAKIWEEQERPEGKLMMNLIDSLAYRVFILRRFETEAAMREAADRTIGKVLKNLRELVVNAGAVAQRLVEDFPAKDSPEYAESAAIELNYCGDLHALLKEHVPVIDMYTKNIKGQDAAPMVDAAILRALREIEKHSNQYKEDVYYAMTPAPTIK